MKLKDTSPWKKSYDKPRQCIKKQRQGDFPAKVPFVKAIFFSVGMYRCDSWTIEKAECRRFDAFKLWCWWRLLRDPWTARRLTQSILKEISAEAETPIFWPLDVKNWLIWKDPVAGEDRRWEEKGMREDEMVGWHHRLNGHESEQTQGDSHQRRSHLRYHVYTSALLCS